MRWILCGKNDAAVSALEHLVDRGDEVWAIGNRADDGVDGWQRSFRGSARRLGVRFDQPERINGPAFVDRLTDFGADALLSIQYDQILKANLFEKIGCPTLNLHFALLPRHRGVAPVAWAILEGDAEAGVTLHHMVVEIDAGAVIAQRSVPIGAATTARELYDDLTKAARDLFAECYPFGSELLSVRIPQDDRLACYHKSGDFDFSRRVTDWSRDAAELQRWLRAMIFPPIQRPEIVAGRRRLMVARVDGGIHPDRGAAPGTVLEATPAGLLVGTGAGALFLTELLEADGSGIEPNRVFERGQRLEWEERG